MPLLLIYTLVMLYTQVREKREVMETHTQLQEQAIIQPLENVLILSRRPFGQVQHSQLNCWHKLTFLCILHETIKEGEMKNLSP